MQNNYILKYNEFCLESAEVLSNYVNAFMERKYIQHPTSAIFHSIPNLKHSMLNIMDDELSVFQKSLNEIRTKLVC